MWDDVEDSRSQNPLGNPALPQFSTEQQEVMLKRKAALLDEFLRNGMLMNLFVLGMENSHSLGGMEPRAVEDRIQILHKRINSLEAELVSNGI